MRILLIHDVDDWSFHNISNNIRRVSGQLSPGRHEFRAFSRQDWICDPDMLLDALEWSQAHLFFWRFDLVSALDVLNISAARRDHLIRLMAERITLTAVYDHLYQKQDDLAELGDPFAVSDLTFVSSTKLRSIYTAAAHLPDPVEVCIDGVDTRIFTPRRDRPAARQNTMRVGWVGNSAWGNNIGVDMKGFHTIFLPGVAQAKQAGVAIETRLADRATAPVARQRMPAFYRDLDVYVCSSLIEGTPNPLLEAISAGIIVLTTDVGVANDVLGPKQKQLIVERSPDAIATALTALDSDPECCEALRAENLARREQLSWEHRYLAWGRLFAQAEALLHDPVRKDAKAISLRRLLERRRSALARLRHFVFSRPRVHRFYLKMLDKYPAALKRVRNLFRYRKAT